MGAGGGNVFLIGYRGSGKTSVARLLAGRLGGEWVDADAALVERFGRTIAEIFATEGEAAFRDKEEVILEDLCRGQGRVVATGGGVVLRPANRDRLKRSGRVAWLTADAETLWRRLQADAATHDQRPTLTRGGREEIEELLRVREPLYRACADWIIDTTNKTPPDVAAELHARLSELRC